MAQTYTPRADCTTSGPSVVSVFDVSSPTPRTLPGGSAKTGAVSAQLTTPARTPLTNRRITPSRSGLFDKHHHAVDVRIDVQPYPRRRADGRIQCDIFPGVGGGAILEEALGIREIPIRCRIVEGKHARRASTRERHPRDDLGRPP